MSEQLAPTTDINIWHSQESIEQIRNTCAPDLSIREFDLFVSLGRATGLNPFLREIWAVKYDKSKAAQMFIGRDGYRKSAQRHPLYDYHTSDAVYSNDTFTYDAATGTVTHKYGDLNNRGALVGAYALAQRKGSSRPTYVFANLSEYRGAGQALWGSKPATMIKKVAEAQALRACFQELFAGTYDESEDWRVQQMRFAMENPQRGINGLREKLGLPIINQAPETDFIDEIDEESFTKDAVIHMIKESLTIQELQEAGKLAKNFNTEDRAELRPFYEARRDELKNLHINKEPQECSHSTLNP